MQPAQQLFQAGHVEDIAKTLAVGLKHDREIRVAACHLEQALGLQSLLPQGRATSGVGAGDEQRPGGVLAKARAKQRRAAKLGGDRLLDLLGFEQHEIRGGGQGLSLLGVEVG